MKGTVKKELLLEGLSCRECLSTIDREINKIKNVEVVINYDTKVLSVEVSESSIFDYVLSEIYKIVGHHRHQITINEKSINKTREHCYLVGKLSCASCAQKMESQIRLIDGVSDATLDFTTQKLVIETKDESNIHQIFQAASDIVRRIEPGAKILDIEEEHHGHHHGSDDFRYSLITIILAIIPFILGLIFNDNYWLSFSLLLVSYLIVGSKVIIEAVKNIFRGEFFDENFLMVVATVGAFAIKEYPEAVAVMLFYSIGELFQDLAVNRSRQSISKLMDIKPEYANLLVGEKLEKVKPEEVKIGELVVVRPGERIPLDGIVVKGDSYIDTSALSGESIPRYVEVGNEVLSGSINTSQLLTIQTTKAYDQSMVNKILDLVENASRRKAPTENFITKFAKYYTPIVVGLALLIAFIPPILFMGEFSTWINRALIFLVISCPCALVISIPLGFFGGIGSSSRNGILVKGGNYLEALNNIETIVFDKTGTLTKGNFVVSEVNNYGEISQDELLEIAAYAEKYSLHPIAQSIVNTYQKEIDESKIIHYQEIAGMGIKVTVGSKAVLAGNEKLMKKYKIKYPKYNSLGTIVYLASDGKYLGNLVITDEVKSDSKQAINDLKNLGISKTMMLTGDLKNIGEEVGRSLDIDEVYSELLPNEKVEIVDNLIKNKKSKGKIAFVGDGINDAPVLARADIGIAMGGLGSDAAIEAADIVIMNDEVSKITTAIHIAKRTKRIVWENIIFALLIKFMALVLGALGLITMWVAVFADVGVSLLAILNAMRILKYKY